MHFIIIYLVFVPVHFVAFYLHDKDPVWHKNFIEKTDKYKVSWKSIALRSFGFPIYWAWFVVDMIIRMIRDHIAINRILKKMKGAEIEELIKLTDEALEIIDR